MASLDVVIVDYRAGDLLRSCLQSLAASPPREVHLDRVVVVDNAPGPHSLKEEDFAGLPLVAIRNPSNRGFAAACNQGAADSSADYLLFLNPDTRVVEGSLDRPVGFLKRDEQAATGIVGVQLLGNDGEVARTCYRFPRAVHFLNKALGLDRLSLRLFPNGSMSDWDHAETRTVDQVMGAFFLVRRSLFEQLGGFDERFFVYFEEMDLSLRAFQTGFRTVYLAEAAAYHSGGGTTHRIRAQRLFFSLRSRVLYGEKHFSRFAAFGMILVSGGIEPLTRAVHELARRSWDGVRETWNGYKMFWSWLLRRGATPRSSGVGSESR